MRRDRQVPTGKLWLVTFVYSGLSIIGVYYSASLAMVKVYGILMAVTLPFLCALHYVAESPP